jgi:hypothetical protein
MCLCQVEDDSEEKKLAKAKELEERSSFLFMPLPLFSSSHADFSSSPSDCATSELLVRWKNRKRDCERPIPRRALRLGCKRLQARVKKYLLVLQQRCLRFQQVTTTVTVIKMIVFKK